MKSRRFHTKSRRGCTQCKKSRQKCDEGAPGCSRCEKRGVICSFVSDQSALFVIRHEAKPCLIQPAPLPVEKSSSIIPIQPKQPPPPFLTPMRQAVLPSALQIDPDERLLTYWVLHTCYTGWQEDGEMPIWVSVLPNQAFKIPYLFSMFCSMASVHLAIVEPSHQHRQNALVHHHRAIKLFRPVLTNINKDNAVAVYATTQLVAMYAFGSARAEAKINGKTNVLKDAYNFFFLSKGIFTVYTRCAQWVPELMGPNVPSRPFKPLAPAIEKSLALLSARADSLKSTKEEREGHEAAIEILRLSFHLSDLRPNDPAAGYPFMILIPMAFIELFREGDELALCCVGHWAVVMHWAKNNIWVGNWGKDILDAVRAKVGKEWESFIDWPLKEVYGDMQE